MNCELCEYDLRADAYLCGRCTEATAERVADLPGLYSRLEEMLLPSAQSDYRSPRAIHSPTLVSFDVADARGQMATTLGSWHRALFDALEWDAPPLIDRQAVRIMAAVKALLGNVKWIAGSWPAAGDFAREIRELHADMCTVVRKRERGTRMGLCPTLVNGAVCGAPLRLPVGGKVADCDWCGTSYPPQLWPALRLAQQAAFSPEAKAS